MLDPVALAARALEALRHRHPQTAEHCVRVGEYALALALAAGLPSGLAREIGLGGTLHDVGKLGVSAEVLDKPGPLTPEEYAHVMRHTVIGWRSLAPHLATRAPAALAVVRSHHERYDGRGTPDRLAGDAIHLGARIVAVVDAFDAMTQERPYRPRPLTGEKALAELTRQSGTRFDPFVVAAFGHALEHGVLAPAHGWVPAAPWAGDGLPPRRTLAS